MCDREVRAGNSIGIWGFVLSCFYVLGIFFFLAISFFLVGNVNSNFFLTFLKPLVLKQPHLWTLSYVNEEKQYTVFWGDLIFILIRKSLFKWDVKSLFYCLATIKRKD